MGGVVNRNDIYGSIHTRFKILVSFLRKSMPRWPKCLSCQKFVGYNIALSLMATLVYIIPTFVHIIPTFVHIIPCRGGVEFGCV